jgi:hypothetical protein
MNQPVYDYIVLGASLPGIAFAVSRSLNGRSVLLTNAYGFPGGSLTEFLNCYQEADESSLHGTTREIYRRIAPEMFGPAIVNPESLKFALQQALESASVEMYFHAVPKQITASPDGAMEVSLLVREGIACVRGKKILDATETFDGAALLGRNRHVQRRALNMFITRPANEHFLADERIIRSVRLPDGRYWVSLRVDSHEPLFGEYETHELADSFRRVLEQSGGRIQLLPLGAHTVCEIDHAGASSGTFATLDDILGASLGPSQQFLKASMIEQTLERF